MAVKTRALEKKRKAKLNMNTSRSGYSLDALDSARFVILGMTVINKQLIPNQLGTSDPSHRHHTEERIKSEEHSRPCFHSSISIRYVVFSYLVTFPFESIVLRMLRCSRRLETYL